MFNSIAPYLRLAVEALRLGTLHAQDYAEWRDEAVDRALAPALVRKEAKRQFIAANHSVEDETGFEPEFLANLGLCLTAAGVKIRLLRSAVDHQVPVPGQSQARQIYYTQPGLPFDEVDGALAEPPQALRLVLHWSTDDEYSLDRVYLACPEKGVRRALRWCLTGMNRSGVDTPLKSMGRCRPK